jgi:hypothetical protein
MLEGYVRFEGIQVLFSCQKKEISAMAHINGLAQLFLETVKHREAEEGESDVDLRGELITDPPCTLARCFLSPKGVSFQEENVLAAFEGKVISGACPHHSTPHYNDICGLW